MLRNTAATPAIEPQPQIARRNALSDSTGFDSANDLQSTILKGLSLRLLLIFLLACAVPLAFAVYTQHAWEDFYITFRVSKNLATGHGLVFNVGDRLHTFTSPLGVLLPALTSLLTGNTSDAAALWLFRGLCIAAFSLAATLLFATTTRLRYPAVATFGLVCLLITDAKSVDFTVNGMETGFVLLGFAYAFWAMFGVSTRAWLHLGVAWACLMWSRPDSFIYIGLFSGAVLLFNQPDMTRRTRGEWLQVFLRAAAVATVLYLPWFVFSWAYYGSPVPHTVVAKSMLAPPRTLARFIWKSYMFDSLFMPANALFGGWPAAIGIAGRITAMVLSVVWVVPGLRTETKAASFTLLGSHFYLSYNFTAPFPWYLCLPALLGFVTLSGLLAQAISAPRKIAVLATAEVLKFFLVVASLTVVLGGAWLTMQSAKQLKLQQAIIENGTRREIGLWLREHAAPSDTVLLEPLGYIGYFSGLKTYDVPGLSSREVVEVERRFGMVWGAIAAELHPDWLVLRPDEIKLITQSHPHLLEEQYERTREFNVRDQVERLAVYGRGYLKFDSVFTVFRRRSNSPSGRQGGR
jgi:hypothetical protein